jgi:hypothetical protein
MGNIMGDTESQCQRSARRGAPHLLSGVRKCNKTVFFFGRQSKIMRYCSLIVCVRSVRHRFWGNPYNPFAVTILSSLRQSI